MLRSRQDAREDAEPRETPSVVVWAVAAGTAPLPFLAVYAVMFIVHGGVHKVAPPDITSTPRGELIAGVIALVAFVLAVVALLWFLNGRRRWPFLLAQLALLATAVDFIVDETKGGRGLSVIVALAEVAALVLAALPVSADWVGRRPRRRVPVESDVELATAG